MKRTSLITGRYQITYSSADPIQVLRKFEAIGLALIDIRYIDTFTIQLYTSQKPSNEAHKILNLYAQDYQVKSCNLLQQNMHRLIHRPIILIGFGVLFFLTFLLQSRILFVQVRGNEAVPSNLIVEVARDCGIYFGASRRSIRSEQVKNNLIEHLPQFEWVGINTYGCVAEIFVKEGSVNQEAPGALSIGSIVAARDGIILSCTTLQGTQICRPGQAVTKGQLLVSGYTDCGIYIQGTIAEGEVLAATNRDVIYITPNKYQSRYVITGKKRRFRLTIGKYLINFYEDSGISPISCVKIYQEFPLKLPGGFNLPICLVEEQLISYESKPHEIDLQWMAESCRQYLKSQMIVGRIISEDLQTTQSDDVVKCIGKYFCTEMIGQIKLEETL